MQSCTQNCACLPSDLFIPGNIPLPPDIQQEQDAALSSAKCGISGFDPLDILAECVDTIDGATIDPNPDTGTQFLQELFANSAAQTNRTCSNNSATQPSLYSDALSWVPLVMRSRDFKPGFRLSKRFSTRCPRGKTAGGYKFLNHT